jgi:hypothetical protein
LTFDDISWEDLMLAGVFALASCLDAAMPGRTDPGCMRPRIAEGLADAMDDD